MPKYRVKWGLYDAVDKTTYGWDTLESETPLTKREISTLMNTIGNSIIEEDIIRERMPNFYGAHVKATRPDDWKILQFKEVNDK